MHATTVDLQEVFKHEPSVIVFAAKCVLLKCAVKLYNFMNIMDVGWCLNSGHARNARTIIENDPQPLGLGTTISWISPKLSGFPTQSFGFPKHRN